MGSDGEERDPGSTIAAEILAARRREPQRGLWQNRAVGHTPRARGEGMRAITVLLLALAMPALADTAAVAPAPICTDRPTKSTGTCTADAGHLQLEADLASYSELSLDGTRTETLLLLNPTLKYGLTPRLDVELNVPAWTQTRTHDASGTSTVQGSGDLSLKFKQKLYTGPVLELALMPVVKAPTAAHAVGNGAWEGGVLLPVVAKLSEEWSLNLSPELDVLANASGGGHHVNTAQLVNLGRTFPHDVTLSIELWADWDRDPTGSQRQVSFDLGAAWLLSPSLQLDGGVNLGLNRLTPGVQAYLGISQRF